MNEEFYISLQLMNVSRKFAPKTRREPPSTAWTTDLPNTHTSEKSLVVSWRTDLSQEALSEDKDRCSPHGFIN